MCGEPMRLVERESHTRIPGGTETKVSRYTEWVCRECDYFEEIDEEEAG